MKIHTRFLFLILALSTPWITYFDAGFKNGSQDSGSFLTVTYNNSTQISNVWLVSKSDVKAKNIKALPLISTVYARDLLPKNEQDLINETSVREPLIKDWQTRKVNQKILGAWQAKDNKVMILYSMFLCYNIDTFYCFGIYRFTLYSPIDSIESEILQIPLHHKFEQVGIGCIQNLPVSVNNVWVSVVQSKFSFTLNPNIRCSGSPQQSSRTFIVDHSQSLAEVETLESVNGVSWSPDENSLAYMRVKCDNKTCAGFIEIEQLKSAAVIHVTQANELPNDWPSVITWIDNITVIYQWFGFKELSESGVGLKIYSTTQDNLSVYSYERYLAANSLKRISADGILFLGKSGQEFFQLRLVGDKIEEQKVVWSSKLLTEIPTIAASEILLTLTQWNAIFPSNETLVFVSQ